LNAEAHKGNSRGMPYTRSGPPCCLMFGTTGARSGKTIALIQSAADVPSLIPSPIGRTSPSCNFSFNFQEQEMSNSSSSLQGPYAWHDRRLVRLQSPLPGYRVLGLFMGQEVRLFDILDTFALARAHHIETRDIARDHDAQLPEWLRKGGVFPCSTGR
jgi:hypothetical protein